MKSICCCRICKILCWSYSDRDGEGFASAVYLSYN